MYIPEAVVPVAGDLVHVIDTHLTSVLGITDIDTRCLLATVPHTLKTDNSGTDQTRPHLPVFG